ncbi:MAG: 3-hydroxyacyl-CoA dehydrogenase family protein [Proteobacteria bacterium]|nr:3-hydroxyacyl-CoA dehydrogenase family protein [Pseudomonadota bacterium]MBU1742568.1 3-hydroxyacyl-CoA dehydrogenase family protein [Pseudomonadota bacterium]
MNPEQIMRVVVVGAGVMGHSVAQVFATAGVEAWLVDVDPAALERAMGLVESNLKTMARFGRVSEADIPAIVGRIIPTTDLAAAAREADFALETVVEVPAVKQEVFHRLDELCAPGVVLASNTSTLDVFSGARVSDPSRLVYAHWFAPPHIVPLVEIAPGPETAPGVMEFVAALMTRLGKRPVVMKQFVPAFIVNRIQGAVQNVVLEMLAQGWAEPEEIDLAVKSSLGVRLPVVGVAQTLDFTGLDLIFDIMKARGEINPLIEAKVTRRELGAKTSRGIYDYDGRTEAEILAERDARYLRVLAVLEEIDVFRSI